MRASLAVVLALCAAAAQADDALNFLVMGDWGGSGSAPYTTSGEIATAAGMGKVAASSGAKFALALGDNFYSSGIHGDEHDARFQQTFENVFTADSLKADDFFRVVAGNHDHNGNVTAQIAYSAVSNRWRFDDLYWTFTETAPDGSRVQVVFIDTVVLSGNASPEECAAPGVPGVCRQRELKGSELPGPADTMAADTQMQWLEQQLSSSTADYLVVAGHYPVWSICEHGPTQQLIDSVRPLMEKYNVTAYMNGHDHCAEYIDEGRGVQYHTIGSAHGWDTSTAHASFVPKDSLKFHPKSGIGGFASVSFSKAGFTLTHMDAAGNALFAAPTLAPRPQAGPTPPPTPAPPTPAPVPGAWECHENSDAQPKGLADTDHKDAEYSLDSCKAKCEAASGCAVIRYHTGDKHCHTLTGSITRDAYEAAVQPNGNGYETCFKAP